MKEFIVLVENLIGIRAEHNVRAYSAQQAKQFEQTMGYEVIDIRELNSDISIRC